MSEMRIHFKTDCLPFRPAAMRLHVRLDVLCNLMEMRTSHRDLNLRGKWL